MKDKAIYICITPFFPSPDSWRGAYVFDQVKAIQRNSEYEVMVFRPTTLQDKTKSYEVDGIKVHLFPTLQTPSYLFNGIFNGYNGRSFVKAVKALGIDLSRVRFVHTHTGPFAIYGLALKKEALQIKVFVQHHDLDPFTIRNGKWSRWKTNAIFRAKNCIRLFNEVDLHICISKSVKDNLLAFPNARMEETYRSYLEALVPVSDLPSINKKNTYILYNGVDTSLFKPKTIEREKHKDRVFRIGCIANFQDLKDHITLVKAFQILVEKGYTNIRLSLLGSGSTRPEIENYLKEKNLYDLVEWPQEVTHDKLPDYYHSLDLFVLPSIFEGFGCVFTEAYACGIPFMGVYNQGAAECISDDEKDKWLIQPHDHMQLAHIIERQFQENNKQHLCKPYDIDTLISSYLNYIKDLS